MILTGLGSYCETRPMDCPYYVPDNPGRYRSPEEYRYDAQTEKVRLLLLSVGRLVSRDKYPLVLTLSRALRSMSIALVTSYISYYKDMGLFMAKVMKWANDSSGQDTDPLSMRIF
jgi:hypothetical protein